MHVVHSRQRLYYLLIRKICLPGSFNPVMMMPSFKVRPASPATGAPSRSLNLVPRGCCLSLLQTRGFRCDLTPRFHRLHHRLSCTSPVRFTAEASLVAPDLSQPQSGPCEKIMHISAETDNESSKANSGTKFRRFLMQ